LCHGGPAFFELSSSSDTLSTHACPTNYFLDR
jgi:hypothetical protein